MAVKGDRVGRGNSIYDNISISVLLLLPLQGVIIDGCRINGEAADNIGFMLVPMTIATFRQILRL